MKTIVVTGASKGIGFAIAKKFYDAGFNLAVCARNVDGLDVQFPALEGRKVLIESCDVTQTLQLRRFAENILSNFCTVDVLVNNAGTFLPGEVHAEPEGTLETLMATNVYSAYHLTRKLVPQMKQQQSGTIFNISSIAGIQAYPNGGSYSISKFALHGFSKALREELKPHNIRVSCLLPGATLTDSWAGVDLPETRFMKASDIADLVFSIYQLSENTVVEDMVLRPMLGDI